MQYSRTVSSLKAFIQKQSSYPVTKTKSRIWLIRFNKLISDSGSNPESGPNSPPTVGNSQSSPTAAGGSGGGGSSTPIQEESEAAAYGGQLSSASQQGSLSDLSLFSSPSMPNISLGRPHVPSSSTVRIVIYRDDFFRPDLRGRFNLFLKMKK